MCGQPYRRFESSRFRQEVMKNRTLCAVFLLLFFWKRREFEPRGSLSSAARLFSSRFRHKMKSGELARQFLFLRKTRGMKFLSLPNSLQLQTSSPRKQAAVLPATHFTCCQSQSLPKQNPQTANRNLPRPAHRSRDQTQPGKLTPASRSPSASSPSYTPRTGTQTPARIIT